MSVTLIVVITEKIVNSSLNHVNMKKFLVKVEENVQMMNFANVILAIVEKVVKLKKKIV